MSKPTIKDLQNKLAMQYSRTLELEGELKRLKGSPKVQEKLNYANKTVAALMKEVQTVTQYAKKVDAQNEILRESNATLNADYAKELEVANKGISECYSRIDLLNYEILELNKMHNDLIESHNKISAENYALKAEIERTNRHINLAENVIHEAKEQQPTVINHYHNCTINK